MTRKEKIVAVTYIADRLDAYFTFRKTGQQEYENQAFQQFIGASSLFYALYKNSVQVISEMMREIEKHGRLLPWLIEGYADRFEK